MKKWTPYLLVFAAPFLLMVLINEYVDWRLGKSGYVTQGVEAIHSSERLKERCTWVCHNDTDWCKTHHVKFLSEHFALVDQVYFGIVRLLKGTGAYRAANIFFLVLLIPVLMCYLLVRSINMQVEINGIKRKNG
jgi:hypothetical protein